MSISLNWKKDESQDSDFKDAVAVSLPLINVAIRDIEKGIFPKSCLLNIEVPTSPLQNKVADVKKNIEEVQGLDVYPAAQQMLIHQGKVLKDATTLEENKVAENSFIVIMLSKSKASGGASTTSAPSTQAQPATPLAPSQPLTASQAPASTVGIPLSAPEFTPVAPAPAPAAAAALTSLLEAFDLILSSAQNLVVPIKSNSRRKLQESPTAHNSCEFC